MRTGTLLLFLSLFFPITSLKAQLTEHFSDGNFTQNPAWQGDITSFWVNASQKLQSSGSSSSSVISLATTNTAADNTTWEFSVQLTFAPSNSNYVRIYLMSSQANLKNDLDGYYIRIGETGSADGVDLYKQSGSTSTKIIDGIAGRAATNPNLTIRVYRDAIGNWQLFSKQSTETAFVSEGTITDKTFTNTSYFGIVCNYTSTNALGFILDDLTIDGTTPPPIQPIRPISYKDIIITELLADESPRVELPQAEFVELYNTTDKSLSLKGCTLSDPSSKVILPDFTIAPQEYIILCKNTYATEFEAFGKVVSLSSLPSLNNSGDELTLRNPVGVIIDRVKYDISWYQSSVKSEGGWSIELIDLTNPCGEDNNWTASVSDEGGTPGQVNSVAASKPDLTPPTLALTEVIATNQLQLTFSEKLDSISANTLSNYSLNPTIQIETILCEYPFRSVRLTLSSDIQPKQQYTLSIKNLRDCNQNIQTNMLQTLLALPETADSVDVVINEVLFNPRVGGVDFVEIYNRSDKYINLQNWQLANIEEDIPANKKTCTSVNRLLPPKKFVVFTTDATILKNNYPKAQTENFVVMSSMPTFYDEAGNVVLINEKGNIIDQFDYSEDYHFSMIQDKEGVSLERLNVNVATNLPANWHSAAATEGYATPGYQNSQSVATTSTTATIQVTPKVITPNEDGYHDFTSLLYHFSTQGNIATITIFDMLGRQVKQIASNQSLSTEGFFTWDGTSQTGDKVRSGRYVIAFSLFNPTGRTQLFKEDVVVSW
ncbi:lamin tail domain-containing protein [Xanthocytophaga agilis]|uniref:Lamin tail domain-containing protein n=1 Tax=Xanthocytophaga agilis TaxID=3048010 RepID=A0AAE3UIX6_9BACT|nr:lamin tail domain-containing protein [Xanthocytophaga agilis]MDJ1505966.1 lamin tail domain-containing protein [Xanthocytophaga agilis]